MGPKAVDGMADSVDPDQIAPLGAVWSESTLFAKTCLSENLGSLPYTWPWFYGLCFQTVFNDFIHTVHKVVLKISLQ